MAPECPGGCVLAIVGSVALAGNDEAPKLVAEAFDTHRPRRIVSGGAAGVDSMAEDEGKRRGFREPDTMTIHRPRGKGWAYYKARDQLIANDAECLVRIFAGTARTYGSGWTANQAEKRGARVWRIKVGDGPARY